MPTSRAHKHRTLSEGVPRAAAAKAVLQSGSSSPQLATHAEPDGPPETFSYCVMNEAVVDRGAAGALTLLDLFCDDVFVTKVQADGLIVATPTGSTAYSLSAGGSMVHPAVPAMLCTPICPHSLSFRPLIVPDSVTLRIKVRTNETGSIIAWPIDSLFLFAMSWAARSWHIAQGGARKQPWGARLTAESLSGMPAIAPAWQVSMDSRCSAWVAFDGRERREMKRGDSLVIKFSHFPVPAVCQDGENKDWFGAMTMGLNWNLRASQKPMPAVSESTLH